MTASQILCRMFAYTMSPETGGTHYDINHLQKVHSFARLIGLAEDLDEHTQFITEVAAIVHDIACPMLRQKFGSANGKLQEQYGPDMARSFLADCDLDPADVDRIAFLVGHHHTVEGVDGMDWQILLEADFLVNADEHPDSPAAINHTLAAMFRTRTGIALLHAIYLV